MKYYISRSGQQYGPYSLEDLQGMKAQGRVDPSDLAWGEGMAAWTPVSQVLESASGASSAVAAPQPYTPPQQQPYTPPQQQYTPPQQQYTPPQQQYTPPQQQYTPPQQQYSPQQYTPPAQGAAYGAAPAAAYSAPGYNAGYSPQPGSGPMPPSLHWALVLLLGAVVPFFAIVWIFIELGFVKKIDPSCPATKQFITAICAIVGGLVIFFVFMAGGAAAERPAVAMIGGFVLFAGYITAIVFGIMAMFSMRRSIENYYNTVEPIGLRLSGVMTFFFNIYYFQYHFTRISTWKQTGRLV